VAQPLPWIYDYTEEARAPVDFLRKPLLRPTVWTRLGSGAEITDVYQALVDSGADHVLAPDWIAHSIGVEPDPKRELRSRIGGDVRTIRFADVSIHLCPPDSDPLNPDTSAPERPAMLEWRTQVGFFMDWPDPPWLILLGQCGFFDQFTVLMNRHAQRVAVAPLGEFDERFGTGSAGRRPPTARRPTR
jgi:hypothetical protein